MPVLIRPKSVPPELDSVFKSLGVWGRWQILQLILIQLQHLAAAFQLMAIVFLGYEPPYSCVDKGLAGNGVGLLSRLSNSSYVQNGQCQWRDKNTNVTSACNQSYVFQTPIKDSTIVTEWDLVCDKEYQMQLTQTIFVAGQALGATVTTILADRYGRKWISIVSQWALFVFGIGTAFAPNILVFSILRFPMGAFQQGIIMSGSVMPLELIPAEKRAVVHLLGSLTWSICLTLISGLGYLFRAYSWRYLQLAYCSVSLVAILHTFLLDESLRWLYANGKIKLATATLRKAIRMNKVRIDSVLQAYLDAGEPKQVEMGFAFKPEPEIQQTAQTIPDPCESPVSLYDNNPLPDAEAAQNGQARGKETACSNNLPSGGIILDPGENGDANDNSPSHGTVTGATWRPNGRDSTMADGGMNNPTTTTLTQTDGDGTDIPRQDQNQHKPHSIALSAEETDILLSDHDDTTPPGGKYTLLDVIKNRRLLLTASILCFGWIVNSLVYFGLTLASSKLAGDRFINFALIAVVEFPAGVISYVTMQRLGRKITILMFDAIAGAVLIAAVALKTTYGDGLFITLLSIAGKFGVSAAFGSLFTYTPELYPTNLRSLGLGISSAAARIGGMIAPFSIILIKYIPWLPGTVFGSLSLAVCGLVLLLPETRGRELPQTIEEIEEWSRTSKPKSQNIEVIEEFPNTDKPKSQTIE